MGSAPRVGQPYPLVRGPHPAWTAPVIDGRPERRLAQLDLDAALVVKLRQDAADRRAPAPVVDRTPVAVTAVWVDRLDSRIPTNARDLGTNARRAGWTVRYSFATGYGVDSLCVWLKRGDQRARMCYRDGRADAAVAWASDRMIRKLTVTQLGAWMDGADSG